MKIDKVKKAKIGIHIGVQSFTFVEVIAKKINNFVEEKIELTQPLSDSTNFVNLIQKGLSRLNLQDQTNLPVYISLPQRDILIRFFSLPYLPISEIEKSLPFEIKKYIPFSLEEMQYTLQKFHRLKEKRIDMLWVGIKKNIYNQYLSIFQQAHLNIKTLEPSPLSIIRVVYNKIPNRNENIAIVEVSNSESNIVIINNGIPIFTREIKFASAISAKDEAELGKLNNEVRMMSDFYRRQYNFGDINKIALISNLEISETFKEMIKDIAIPIEHLSPENLISSNIKEINLNAIHAASVCMENVLKTSYKINLYTKAKRKGIFAQFSRENAIPISAKAIAKTIAVCLSLLAVVILISNMRIKKLRDEFDKIDKAQPQISEEYARLSVDSLKKERERIQRDVSAMKEASQETAVATKKISALSNVIPAGVWLDNLYCAIKDLKSAEIKLSGFAYKGSQKDESRAIDSFISGLKTNEEFASSFQLIQLSSRIRSRLADYEVEKFSIACSP